MTQREASWASTHDWFKSYARVSDKDKYIVWVADDTMPSGQHRFVSLRCLISWAAKLTGDNV